MPIVPETVVQSQVESYDKFKKWYLMPPCLRYISRVSREIQECCPLLLLGVVAIEKGAFRLLSTVVSQLTNYLKPYNCVQTNIRWSHIKDSKKRYLIYPCLILNIISYVSRVKWSNPRKRVAPFSTPRCGSF